MEVHFIDADRLNPFGASEQEFMAYALDDAGLLRDDTLIDGRPAREFLFSFYRKRELYRESTRLGMVLVNRGVITRDQLGSALAAQQRADGQKLGEIVLTLGFCTAEALLAALEAQARMREDIGDLESCRLQISAVRERLHARL